MRRMANSRVLGRIALRVAASLTLAYILTPLLFVTWLAFFRQEIPSFPPEGYSIRWFQALADNERFVSGFLLSLQIALLATAVGLGLGLPAAFCLARFQFRGHEGLSSPLRLPLVVPAMVV